MDITTARAWVADAVRDQSGISADQFDRAIMFAGDEFCRDTSAISRADDVAITSGSNAFPLTVPITKGFRPERVIDIWVTGQLHPMEQIDYPALNALIANGTSPITYPTHIAFLSNTDTSATLWPTPSAAFTAKLRYWQPFGVTVATTFNAGWPAGTADGPTLGGTLNIPDDLIKPVLVLGAAAMIRTPNPEVKFGTEAWKRFKDYCKECAGAMSLGTKVIQRNPAGHRRWPRRTSFNCGPPGQI